MEDCWWCQLYPRTRILTKHKTNKENSVFIYMFSQLTLLKLSIRWCRPEHFGMEEKKKGFWSFLKPWELPDIGKWKNTFLEAILCYLLCRIFNYLIPQMLTLFLAWSILEESLSSFFTSTNIQFYKISSYQKMLCFTERSKEWINIQSSIAGVILLKYSSTTICKMGYDKRGMIEKLQCL